MILLNDSSETHRRAAKVIAGGGLLAFRTDTFYGLGANPFNQLALQKIFALKGREAGKPILCVISDMAAAARFIKPGNKLFDLLTEAHWPGALTIVAAARPEVPALLTSGTHTIGLRLPNDEQLRAFIKACGGALTATSANRAGEPPARSAAEAARAFPEGLDMIVDGGVSRAPQASTVIDVSANHARLVREGTVKREELLKTFAAYGVELESALP